MMVNGEATAGGRLPDSTPNNVAADLSAAYDSVVGKECGLEHRLQDEATDDTEAPPASKDAAGDESTSEERVDAEHLRDTISKNLDKATATAAPSAYDVQAECEKARKEALAANDQAALHHVNALETSVLLDHVTRFAEAKNSKGEFLRPDFHDLSGKMLELIGEAKSGGKKLTLQKAYDLARRGPARKSTYTSDHDSMRAQLDAVGYRGGNSSRGLM